MWKTKPEVEVKTPPTPVKKAPTPLPTSTPVVSILRTEEMEEYVKVAESLGIANYGATLTERLRRFLSENNIRVYDGEQVSAYLTEQLGKWEWCGLRACDVEHFAVGNWVSHHGDFRIPLNGTQYSQAVPLPVLLTIKKIADQFPDVHFYISRAKNKEGDPFLLIAAKGLNNFIVERWDEPGFRER